MLYVFFSKTKFNKAKLLNEKIANTFFNDSAESLKNSTDEEFENYSFSFVQALRESCLKKKKRMHPVGFEPTHQLR